MGVLDSLEPIVAGARDALGSAGERVGAEDAPPRYELFHGANSICSQKVRTVLAQHGLPYVGHTVNMFLGQTYLPGYVRLRMVGCTRFGGALMARHTGSTSASEGGCDGAVVPTLVDWQTREVVVDSKRICLYLDAQVPPGQRLRPAGLEAAIDAEIAVVDGLPNYQLLMGRTPAASEPGATKAGVGNSFSQKKVVWCDQYLAAHADEPALVQAYTAKRAKELSAAETLFSPEAMAGAYARAEQALQALEERLPRQGGWLFGDAVSLADLFWGVELLRVKNMGCARFWEAGRLPHVAAFAGRTEALPAIAAAVVAWPGAMF